MSPRENPGQRQEFSHFVPEGETIGNGDYRDQSRLSRFIGGRVLDHVTGTGTRSPEDSRVLVDLPSDKHFAGTLSPAEDAEYSDLSDELESKLSPSAIQAEFQVDPAESSEVIVTISGHVYYRTFPTYDQQIEDTQSTATTDDSRGDDGDTGIGESDIEYEYFQRVYHRLEFETDPIAIAIPDLTEDRRAAPDIEEHDAVIQELHETLASKLAEIDDDPDRPPLWRSNRHIDRDIPLDAVPGAPAGTAIDVNEYSGDLYFPSAILGYDAEAENRDSYQALLDEISSGPVSERVEPDWDLTIDIEFFRNDSGVVRGILTVENTSESAPRDGDENLHHTTDFDTTLFDVSADLKLDSGDFVNFIFDRLEEDFRYDRSLPGRGTNCLVVRPEEGDQGRLKTEYLPSYRQQRYVPRMSDDMDRNLDLTFRTLEDLEGGGLEALEAIRDEMWDYLEQQDRGYDQALVNHYAEKEDFTEDDRLDFEEDREAFRKEILRVERAIDCLRADVEDNAMDGRVASSFELMNQTFRRAQDFDGWRPFQLVFILRVLPDIVSREYDDWAEVTWRDGEEGLNYNEEEMEALDLVDIVWFPTGGGKTEAYLGLGIFGAFFDRYRGKNYGVSAWTRFPLRLLSLQQTQRLAKLLMYAEKVRTTEPKLCDEGIMSFSLGYLVGSANTPNKLSGYVEEPSSDEEYIRMYKRYENNEDKRREAKVISECPFCEAPVSVEVTDDFRLAHQCTSDRDDCEWQQRNMDTEGEYQVFAREELPIHIVDNELYRYAPTFVVGTIDKIAAINYERKSAHLYGGKMSHWCPEHGFASLGECTEKYACDSDRAGTNDPDETLIPLEETPLGNPTDISPTLQIQDELHLLKESLGTFDGHYETFVDAYQQEEGLQRTKIVAATATIEEYEKQTKQLYLRKAERFPTEGPFLGENFYAKTEDTTRRQFCGVLPHGKTHINAVIDLLYHYTREIETLRKEIHSATSQHDLIDELGMENIENNDELLELLKLYETSLAYTISKKEKNPLVRSIDGQMADYLRSDDLRVPFSDELTGDTLFDDVEEILTNLENPPADFQERLNMITATNMISHGVDVDRFNYMVFFGMPRQTAEYIQSSSRAGRKHPGLVLLCFNPSRERDQSHYHMFNKYHEYLDRLVEPVPVNRWSQNSVDRTIAGMFFGWLYNRWMYQTGELFWFADNVRPFVRAIREGKVQENPDYQATNLRDRSDVLDLIKLAYGTHLGGELPETFEEQLRRRFDAMMATLEGAQTNFAGEALTHGPMRSLRDIDAEIRLIPDEWQNNSLFDTLEGR
ncbi:helicase-related protein [Haloarcula sediminis]|uniref:helicase-related protein n=1 Tax=Haloarcula sediminis TaxID=3111777 RepID=UPI002D7A0663|nr:helicase-related protein [Haloarcula sp. CK38]